MDTEAVVEKETDENYTDDNQYQNTNGYGHSKSSIEANIGEQQLNFSKEEFRDYTIGETVNIRNDVLTTISGKKGQEARWIVWFSVHNRRKYGRNIRIIRAWYSGRSTKR